IKNGASIEVLVEASPASLDRTTSLEKRPSGSTYGAPQSHSICRVLGLVLAERRPIRTIWVLRPRANPVLADRAIVASALVPPLRSSQCDPGPAIRTASNCAS